MSFEFRDARRANVPLLILIAGGTASGKTESAMRVATGLSGGKQFAVIDTENGRALHKADDYKFKHAELDEPFSPERYAEAVKAADAEGFPVIVIDSGSHEYEGVGGVLDLQSAEFERMGRRESARMSSWIEPKRRHKLFVQQLLRARAHIILCLRAEDKIEIVKQGDKTVVRPKESLVGAQGWIPICEKRLPFEATISLLLLQGNPGVPVPIKLERRHAELVPLDRPLDEQVGARLAEWARGSSTSEVAEPSATAELAKRLPAEGSRVDELTIRLTRMLTGNTRAIAAIRTHREGHTAAQHETWLKRQIERVEAAAAEAGGASEANPAPDAGEGAPSDADLVEQPDGALALTVPAEVRSRMETGQ